MAQYSTVHSVFTLRKYTISSSRFNHSLNGGQTESSRVFLPLYFPDFQCPCDFDYYHGLNIGVIVLVLDHRSFNEVTGDAAKDVDVNHKYTINWMFPQCW